MSSIKTLSRYLELSTTRQYIPDNAAHGSLEPFIPLSTKELLDYLLSRGELTADQAESFTSLCHGIVTVLHHRQRPLHQALERHYTAIDTDRDTKQLVEPTSKSEQSDRNRVTKLMHEVLRRANYFQIPQSKIEADLGVSSEWGVPLNVDFDVFEELSIYARGDIKGIRRLRRWQRLWKEESIEVPIYQRVVILFSLREDADAREGNLLGGLQLRLFKNVPQLDLDMLLPGTRVRVTWMDGTKIVVPTLGSIGFTIWKIVRTALLVAVLSVYTATILVGLVIAAIGYAIRTLFSYWQTKDRYLLNMTRSLYQQKLDNNSGVIYRLLEDAEQQDFREVALAFYGLSTSDKPISRRRLKRKVERILREAIGVEVDFEVDDAIAKLQEFNLLVRTDQNELSCVRPKELRKSLDAWWDQQNLFQYHDIQTEQNVS